MPASVRRLRPALGRPKPPVDRSGLGQRITVIADDLAAVVSEAADLRLAVPTPVTNAVLDLRGWSARVVHESTTQATTVDATRLLAYIRTLPDRQLLALLADLPWPRLDALLDAIGVAAEASSGVGKHP
jgi:hypothetical protein